MTAKPTSPFDHAARFLADLNQRQREVLRLIAEGRTNAEIAGALGITLAGAKWNVSEILSKLGLDTRDQAAAFHRWNMSPHNRLRRTARAITALAPLKAAAAAGSAAVAVAVVALVIGTRAGDNDSGPDSPGAPFYLESHTTRTDSLHETDQLTAWWYGDATHGRQERTTPEIVSFAKGVTPGSISYGPSGVSAYVLDGTFAWSGGSPQYLRRPILPAPNATQWMGGGGRIGPLPDTSIDAFVARLRESAGTDPVKAVRTGRVLGRAVVVVEQSPASGTGVPPRATRYWVDESRLFVMKSEVDSGDGHLRVVTTVTKLRYGEPQDGAKFVWSPSPGAVEITCTSDPARGPMMEPPPGFLAVPPGAIPAGLVSTGVGTGAGRDGTCAQVHIEAYPAGGTGAPGQPFLHVGENREDPGSVLTGSRDDSRVLQPAGVTAYAWREGEVALLAWVHNGLGVQLKSNHMSLDELVALGEAMLAR